MTEAPVHKYVDVTTSQRLQKPVEFDKPPQLRSRNIHGNPARPPTLRSLWFFFTLQRIGDNGVGHVVGAGTSLALSIFSICLICGSHQGKETGILRRMDDAHLFFLDCSRSARGSRSNLDRLAHMDRDRTGKRRDGGGRWGKEGLKLDDLAFVSVQDSIGIPAGRCC